MILILSRALARRLQMVDRQTAMHDIELQPSAAAASSSSSPIDAEAIARCVLDRYTQQAFYEALHGPLTSLQHQTALRRHATCSTCSLSDVLRVSDLGHRVFLMVPLRWRGPFARVCQEWHETARNSWRAEEYELVQVHQHEHLRNLGGPVAQVSSWMRASQTKPVFFLLALTEDGRLEQLHVSCRKAEAGMRRPDADDAVRVERSKEWRLEESVGLHSSLGVASQFVVTKHHAYCVVAVRGQALLVKLGGSSNGTHEHMYTDRFPKRVTTMAMCPLDNNIIAFGLPTAHAFLPPLANCAFDASSHVIELVNFAQSSSIQTLATSHEKPMILLDYSPDSEQLISCSADCIQVWNKESSLESRGPGALDEQPVRTFRMPSGTSIRIAKVHPAWTSALFATNEALEVRELRRPAADSPVRAGRKESHAPLALKWRRENIQITAAAFVAQGNILVVSDRGDRLLLLNYHGLHAAKRCVLPWDQPSRRLSAPGGSSDAAHGHDEQEEADLQAPVLLPGSSGGGSSDGGDERGVRTVTSIVECPDVVGRCAEEWRSGISHLAVSSSRGDVVLLKI